MIRITDIYTMTEHIVFSGEILVSVYDFINILRTDIGNQIVIEECLITPYYIENDKRLELYQYELYVTSECNFEDYILKKTGKTRLEDIPDKIIKLREVCFAKNGETKKVVDYLKFLFSNQDLRREVEQAFNTFNKKNLYIAIY